MHQVQPLLEVGLQRRVLREEEVVQRGDSRGLVMPLITNVPQVSQVTLIRVPSGQ